MATKKTLRTPSRRVQLKNVTLEFMRKHGVANLLRDLTAQQRLLLTLRLVDIVGKGDFSATLTPEDVEELRDLIRRDQLAYDAMKEGSFSGALRRAIQSGRFLIP